MEKCYCCNEKTEIKHHIYYKRNGKEIKHLCRRCHYIIHYHVICDNCGEVVKPRNTILTKESKNLCKNCVFKRNRSIKLHFYRGMFVNDNEKIKELIKKLQNNIQVINIKMKTVS